MKNIKIVVLIAMLCLQACEDRINNVLPRASLSPEAVSSPNDLEKLLVGAYDAMQNGGTTFYYLSFLTFDLSADVLDYRATFFQHGEINDNAILTNNVLVQRYWIGPYVMIYRANEVLSIASRFSAGDFNNPNRLANIIAEAKYIRAHAYLKLVNMFGDVPVLTTNTTANVPRDPATQVWQQIETDLDDAIAGAADFDDINYISKEAARALRARVALIRGDYPMAAQLSESLISSGKYSLASNYASIFTPGQNGGGEVIFQINFTSNEGENSASFFLLDPTVPAGSAGGRFELPVEPSMVAAYEAGDERRDASIAPARGTSYQCIKYKSGSVAADPWIVSRIAEMYLISAEANARIASNPANGMTRLNEVRNERGLASLPTPATLDEFITAILQERRVEFAFEGHRWIDLIRTGRAISELPKVTNANQLLYPIPQTEMDVNPLLVQNPGY